MKEIKIVLITLVIGLVGCTTEVTSKRKILKKDTKEPHQAYLNLGIAYLKNNTLNRAETSLKRSLKLKRTPEALNILGLLYEEIHNNQLAETTYQQLLAEFPDFALGYSNYNIFLCKYDRTEQLNSLAQKIAAKGGAMAAVGQIAAGNCLSSKGKYEQSIVYYKNALVYEPYSAGALLPLAEYDLKKGFVPEAKKKVDLVLNQIGYNSKSVYLSYLVEKELGNMDKEREMLRILQTRYANSNEARLVK